MYILFGIHIEATELGKLPMGLGFQGRKENKVV